MAWLVLLWIAAIGLDAIGSAVVGVYLHRLGVATGRKLAWVMFGASAEATAIFIALFIFPVREPIMIAPIVIRLAFKIVKALTLIPIVSEIAGRRQEKYGK